jgi:CrcB protein
MQNLFLVAIGGAFGSCLRYLFLEMMVLWTRGNNFPIGVVLVNIIGSFLMGVLHFFLVNHLDSISPQTRILLATGLLGGFTTFSAFSLDVFRLIGASQFGLAFAYIFSSVIFSLLAIFFGFYAGKLLFNV